LKEFENQVAIVTGAAKGIGASIAKLLSERGAHTAIVDIDESEAASTCEEIRSKNGKALFFAGDVTKSEFANEITEKLTKDFGQVHILVNNAGIIRDGFISKISEKDWEDVMDVNLKAPFLFSKAVSEKMRENQFGKIVNIISRAWLGNVGQSNYSASKGGLVSLTRTLALELARYQINVNGVAPGLIDTPMTKALPEKVKDKLISLQPTKKMGTTKDIAEAVSFLASDKSNFITGQILHVDGGKSCGLLSL
jgi:NAD(P)-dependent dehydrogenase (short-subunit alcohol dehydrogenase family)